VLHAGSYWLIFDPEDGGDTFLLNVDSHMDRRRYVPEEGSIPCAHGLCFYFKSQSGYITVRLFIVWLSLSTCTAIISAKQRDGVGGELALCVTYREHIPPSLTPCLK
jgi:hypothetical protein